MTRFSALLPRSASEAIGRLMKADKLMFEVDHGARRAYEERAAESEPGARRGPAARRSRRSATPPEFGEALNLLPPEAVIQPTILVGRIYDQTWGRGFSALYDRCFKAAEEAGLREMRRDVLAGARGRVLEVGAGTGLNIELYPERASRA